MATNENNRQASELVWTSSKEWGSDGFTYRAATNEWKFICDLPHKGGPWSIRGWGPDHQFLYREAKTLKDAKILAQRLHDLFMGFAS